MTSNSLLETLVYSDKIFNYLSKTSLEKTQYEDKVTDWKFIKKPAINPDYVSNRKAELQYLMRQNAGIVRNDSDLFKAKEKISIWKNEIEEKINTFQINADLCELQNLITIGNLIVQQSIERNENCGGFVKINS